MKRFPSALPRILAPLAFAAFAAAAFPTAAVAQLPMKVSIPAEAGSEWDRAGRTLGAALASIGAATTVEYDNRPGGRGAVGLARFLATEKGNPGAMLVAGQDLVIAAELDRTAARLHDAVPLVRLAVTHYAVYVPANSPTKTWAELARAFKADPAGISWEIGSQGSGEHLFIAYLAKALGVDPAKVRLAAAGSKTATAGVARLRDLGPAIDERRVRALAVSSPAATAGIASLKEQGTNAVFGQWHGLFAAPGIRPSQRDELLQMVKAATQTHAWTVTLRELGWTAVPLQGSDYARFIDEESRSLGYLADSVGLRPKR